MPLHPIICMSSKFIQRSDMITSYHLRNSENKLAIPLPRTIIEIAFSYSGAVRSSGTVCPQLSGKQHL